MIDSDDVKKIATATAQARMKKAHEPLDRLAKQTHFEARVRENIQILERAIAMLTVHGYEVRKKK